MEREPRKKNPNVDSIYSYPLQSLMDRIQNSNYINLSEKETIINSIDTNTCTKNDMNQVTDLLVKMGLITAPQVKTGGGGEGEGEPTYNATEEALRQEAATALLGVKNMPKEIVNVNTDNSELNSFFTLAKVAKAKIENVYNVCVHGMADSMIQASLASYLTGKLVLLANQHQGDIFTFLGDTVDLIGPYLKGTTAILATTAVGTVLKKVIRYYVDESQLKINEGVKYVIELNKKVNTMKDREVVEQIKDTINSIQGKIGEEITNYKASDLKTFKGLVDRVKKTATQADENRIGEITIGDINTAVNAVTPAAAAVKRRRGYMETLGDKEMDNDNDEEMDNDNDEEMDNDNDEEERIAKRLRLATEDAKILATEDAKRLAAAEEANRIITDNNEETQVGGKRKSKKRRITKKKKHIKRKATKKKKYSKSKTKRKVHKKK